MANYIKETDPKYTKTLPFEINDMEFVKENQKDIRVLMDDLRFPIESKADKEQIRTSMIYLRNIGYTELNLDFRGCPPGMIAKYLIEYITTQFDVKNIIFAEAWLGIISDDPNMAINMFIDTPTFNSVKNVIYDKAPDLITELKSFIKSIPLYAMGRYNHEGLYTLDEFEHTDYDKFGININHIIDLAMQYEAVIIADERVFKLSKTKVKYFDKYFTVENNELFEVTRNSLAFAVLGSMSSEDNICKQILTNGAE